MSDTHTTTRRAAIGAIAAAATMPATAAIAGASDPIFSMIDAWRETERVHDEECTKTEMEGGWTDRMSETASAYHAAAMAMAKTVPTTIAGAAALLEIAANDIEGGEAAWQEVALWSAATTIRRFCGGDPLHQPGETFLTEEDYQDHLSWNEPRS